MGGGGVEIQEINCLPVGKDMIEDILLSLFAVCLKVEKDCYILTFVCPQGGIFMSASSERDFCYLFGSFELYGDVVTVFWVHIIESFTVYLFVQE